VLGSCEKKEVLGDSRKESKGMLLFKSRSKSLCFSEGGKVSKQLFSLRAEKERKGTDPKEVGAQLNRKPRPRVNGYSGPEKNLKKTRQTLRGRGTRKRQTDTKRRRDSAVGATAMAQHGCLHVGNLHGRANWQKKYLRENEWCTSKIVKKPTKHSGHNGPPPSNFGKRGKISQL